MAEEIPEILADELARFVSGDRRSSGLLPVR
jgi:hypothetical protein